jgi:hypothetical protein
MVPSRREEVTSCLGSKKPRLDPRKLKKGLFRVHEDQRDLGQLASFAKEA